MSPAVQANGSAPTVANYQVVQRVASLPLVTSAVKAYDQAKVGYPILTKPLGMAEAVVKIAYTGAAPILNQLPLGYVDKVACQGLDVLEHQVPAIRRQPEDLVATTKSYIVSVRGYGEAQVTRTVVYGLSTVDAGLSMAESVVDKVLPASLTEKQKDGFAEKLLVAAETAGGRASQVYDHALGLGEKVKHRLSETAVVQYQALQVRSSQAIARLRKALEPYSSHPAIQAATQSLLDTVNRLLVLAQKTFPKVDSGFLVRAQNQVRDLYETVKSQATAENARERLTQIQDLLNQFFHQAIYYTGAAHLLPSSITNSTSTPVPRINVQETGNGGMYTPRENLSDFE